MHNSYQGPAIRPFARILLNTQPTARASVRGDAKHRSIRGTVNIYPVPGGSLVTAEIHGLPQNSKSGIFAMHIHEGGFCTGNQADPFADTGGHYNPDNKPHPLHAGDLPPLFSNNGFAYYCFYTNRFTPAEVTGRTVVIHSDPDDFRTQPAGASGSKIACGAIRKA